MFLGYVCVYTVHTVYRAQIMSTVPGHTCMDLSIHHGQMHIHVTCFLIFAIHLNHKYMSEVHVSEKRHICKQKCQ